MYKSTSANKTSVCQECKKEFTYCLRASEIPRRFCSPQCLRKSKSTRISYSSKTKKF